MIFTNIRKEFEHFGLQNTKKINLAGKMYSRMRTFGAKIHKSNIRVTKWHNKYKI